MPLPIVPSEQVTAKQFAVQFRRMLFALNRLYENIVHPTGDVSTSEQAQENRREAGELMERAIADVENEIGADWRRIGADASTGWQLVAERIRHMIARHRPGFGESNMRILYGLVANAINTGQGILNDDVAFREHIAQDELAFWTYAREIAQLPQEAFTGILRRGGEIMGAAAGAAGSAAGSIGGGALSGLLDSLFKNPVALVAIGLALYFAFGRNRKDD